MGADFYTFLTLAHFEELCQDFFRGTVDAKADKDQVHEIVFVGGSTRIPQVIIQWKGAQQVDQPGRGRRLQCRRLDTILKDETSEKTQNSLLDVAPLSLGINTAGGVMTALIRRNLRRQSARCPDPGR